MPLIKNANTYLRPNDGTYRCKTRTEARKSQRRIAIPRKQLPDSSARSQTQKTTKIQPPPADTDHFAIAPIASHRSLKPKKIGGWVTNGVDIPKSATKKDKNDTISDTSTSKIPLAHEGQH